MGKLAVVDLKWEHNKTLTRDEERWLILAYHAALVRLREFEEALAQRGHVVELTEYGWAIEHTVECRSHGILNCIYHLKLSSEYELNGLDAYDDGRYRIELGHDGHFIFYPLGEENAV